jgi:hypothetical protein
MITTKKLMARITSRGPWSVMSIPGRDDDGSDTAWFAYHRDGRQCSKAFDRYDDAAAECRRRNGGA